MSLAMRLNEAPGATRAHRVSEENTDYEANEIRPLSHMTSTVGLKLKHVSQQALLSEIFPSFQEHVFLILPCVTKAV